MKMKTWFALIVMLLLAGNSTARADNNLHFYGNLLSKSCTTGSTRTSAG